MTQRQFTANCAGLELSTRLRAEAAYKLGLCHLQMKNVPGVIEAFTYYVQTFPDSPQVPAALRSAGCGIRTKQKLHRRACGSKHSAHQISQSARARSDVAVKSSDPGPTEKTPRAWSETFSPAFERISQELGCSTKRNTTSARLHSKRRITRPR